MKKKEPVITNQKCYFIISKRAVNYKVEFDSLKRLTAYTYYDKRSKAWKEIKVRLEMTYNSKGQKLNKKKYYQQGDEKDIVTVWKYFYDVDVRSYQLAYIFDEYETPNLVLNDSTIYFYDTNNNPIKEDSYVRDDLTESRKLQFLPPSSIIDYEYNNHGQIIKKQHSDGLIEEYVYETRSLSEKTWSFQNSSKDLFKFYPQGIVKYGKINYGRYAGIHEFMETGDVLTWNGNKAADYSEYDEYGNWTKRILYNEKGQPETHTKRIITYYE